MLVLRNLKLTTIVPNVHDVPMVHERRWEFWHQAESQYPREIDESTTENMQFEHETKGLLQKFISRFSLRMLSGVMISLCSFCEFLLTFLSRFLPLLLFASLVQGANSSSLTGEQGGCGKSGHCASDLLQNGYRQPGFDHDGEGRGHLFDGEIVSSTQPGLTFVHADIGSAPVESTWHATLMHLLLWMMIVVLGGHGVRWFLRLTSDFCHSRWGQDNQCGCQKNSDVPSLLSRPHSIARKLEDYPGQWDFCISLGSGSEKEEQKKSKDHSRRRKRPPRSNDEDCGNRGLTFVSLDTVEAPWTLSMTGVTRSDENGHLLNPILFRSILGRPTAGRLHDDQPGVRSHGLWIPAEDTKDDSQSDAKVQCRTIVRVHA